METSICRQSPIRGLDWASSLAPPHTGKYDQFRAFTIPVQNGMMNPGLYCGRNDFFILITNTDCTSKPVSFFYWYIYYGGSTGQRSHIWYISGSGPELNVPSFFS